MVVDPSAVAANNAGNEMAMARIISAEPTLEAVCMTTMAAAESFRHQRTHLVDQARTTKTEVTDDPICSLSGEAGVPLRIPPTASEAASEDMDGVPKRWDDDSCGWVVAEDGSWQFCDSTGSSFAERRTGGEAFLMVGFGLFCLMGYRDQYGSASDVLRDTVELVRRAEEAGFDAAWFAEHHFSNYCVCPSPLLMVNHCAAATSRIKLGPAALVVPLYHPIRLLAEIGMTAALCGDRLLLGIGSGYQPFEFERYNADLGQSKERREEFLSITDRAYAGETFAFDGTFTSIPRSCISTRPAVLPQIWIAGDSEATHRLAARRGFVPIITGRFHGADYPAEQRARIDASYAKEGLGALPHPLGVLRFLCVTESAAETRDYLINARRQLRFAAALRYRQEVMDGGILIERPAENEASLEEMAENLAVGDIETVAERLIADIRASGASHVMLNIQTLGSTMEQARRSIEVFGCEIRPRVERAIAGTGPTQSHIQ